MHTIVRATCPMCHSTLRIPAQWVGQMVRCKKCRAVVRSKPRHDDDTPRPVSNGTAEAAPLVQPPARAGDNGGPVAYPLPVPAPYPYPVAPGYPYVPSPGYGPPPGYPYAPPVPGMPPVAQPIPPVANVPVGVPMTMPAPVPTYGPVKPGMPAGLPAHYPQSVPVPQYPDPVPPSNEFKTDAAPPSASARYRRSSGKSKLVWLALCLLMTGGLVAAGIYGAKYLNEYSGKNEPIADSAKLVEQLGSSDQDVRDAAMKSLREMGAKAEAALRTGVKSDNREVATRCEELLTALGVGGGSGSSGGSGVSGAKGAFPRRLLFIHISKYMYLNPLTAGQAGIDGTKPAANHLAFQWRVPTDKDNNQVFVLSDTATPDPPIPMKGVVTGAYERFFDTSRAQDRIVVYFGGHALEKDGKAYLAPVEGELDDASTLIPLDEFYKKFAHCKATQKVVIWDVCRFNPERGTQRPGSEPMTEALAKALAAAPAGIEVVNTCQPGENALEFNNLAVPATPKDLRYAGSAFLESLRAAPAKGAPAAKAPTPADLIPVAEWAQALGKRVADVAVLPAVGAKQSVKADGKPRADQVAFNPDEPPAKRFEMPTAPKGTSPLEVTLIAREFFVPPIKSDLTDTGLTELPYLESVMKDYKADILVDDILKERDKHKFRVAVIDTFQSIREVWGSVPGASETIDEVVMAPITDAIKRNINAKLEFYAIGIAKLELNNLALDEVESLKAGETKRWQAHYEYARAVLKSRLAYLNEFNKLMGDIRTETLPALEKNQNGYKLVSSEKMKSRKDVAKLADEAQEAYTRLITEHKGTPWAIQAKREKNFSLGLAWRPISTDTPGPK